MNVVRVDFLGSSIVDLTVLPKARHAAALLATHTGCEALVRVVGGVASARVASGYRLEVAVGVYPVLRRMPRGADVREWLVEKSASPRVLGVDVVVDPEWLLDPTSSEGTFGCEHAYREFDLVDEALAWVRASCLRVPVPRVSSAELGEWAAKTVAVADSTSSGVSEVTLADAVSIFGSVYGQEISTAVLLADKHRMTTEDAVAVAEAVLKVVPRRRKT